jgi:superfamily II DNA or RNA helicase
MTEFFEGPVRVAVSSERGLRALPLKVCYRTPDDILNSFYIPCLENSLVYKRATGYFTSAALAEAARGLVQFSKNDGMMYLVAGPRLTESDIKAIREGYDARKLIEEALIRGLRVPIEEPDILRVRNLSWMIANGRLEIKIAHPTTIVGEGIYHEKMGIFLDSFTQQESNVVCFSGSMNETGQGLLSNYESLDVSISWEPGEREQNRIKDHIHHFAQMWEGTAEGLHVMEFPEVVRRELLERFNPPDLPEIEPGMRRSLKTFQSEAITAWENAGKSGILAMATGSGKTFTALRCAEQYPNTIALIIVPQTDLLSQWCNEISQEFPQKAIIRRVEASENDWQGKVDRSLEWTLSSPDSDKRLFIVATIQSACKDRFIETLSKAPSHRMMVIVDEVHHSGAAEYSNVFRLQADFRLGLSATPYRMWDDEGNQNIFEYFGGEVYDYSIQKAISDHMLSPYRYFIHPVALNKNEREQFADLSRKIARLLSSLQSRYPGFRQVSIPQAIQMLETTNPARANELRNLYLRRINLLKSAEAKSEALIQIVRNFKDLNRCLVYCNDLNHVSEVVSILFDQGLEALEYTSRVESSDRERLRSWLGDERMGNRFLVAVRCLDEGVDIPACDSAILISSSRSTREFVQRRGRVLRKHPSKKEATIHDIVVLPFVKPEDAYALTSSEIEFVRAELNRVGQFAKDALNHSEIDVDSLLSQYESEMVA